MADHACVVIKKLIDYYNSTDIEVHVFAVLVFSVFNGMYINTSDNYEYLTHATILQLILARSLVFNWPNREKLNLHIELLTHVLHKFNQTIVPDMKHVHICYIAAVYIQVINSILLMPLMYMMHYYQTNDRLMLCICLYYSTYVTVSGMLLTGTSDYKAKVIKKLKKYSDQISQLRLIKVVGKVA